MLDDRLRHPSILRIEPDGDCADSGPDEIRPLHCTDVSLADPVLPNLIVIGAEKCGTTSLHYYLDRHPEIAMSAEKELRFFVDSGAWHRGLDWYSSQFDPSAPIRGESSPRYTAYPWSPEAPGRMAALIPDARLVYLVRDPIDRIVSSYRFARWLMGNETRELAESLADFEASLTVQRSRYAFQLERYLEHFPREQVLVLDLTDPTRSRAEVLQRVFRFLGVDDTFTSPAFGQVLHVTDARRNPLGRVTVAALDAALGKRRSNALRSRAPRAVLHPFVRRTPRVSLDPALRTALADYLRKDAARLRALTGEAFAHWSV